jgi:DEAD/DEAH box helicase domain-containing protein
MLRQVLPKLNEEIRQDIESDTDYYLQVLLELSHRGVLSYDVDGNTIGFPLPPGGGDNNSLTRQSSNASPTNNANTNSSIAMLQQIPSKLIGKGLHGSSETSARRRMNVLKWSLDIMPSWVCKNINDLSPSQPESTGILKTSAGDACKTTVKGMRTRDNDDHGCNGVGDVQLNQSRQVDIDDDERCSECIESRTAYLALDVLLSGSGKVSDNGISDRNDSVDQKRTTKQWLPCQAAYAGSHQGREVRYGKLSNETLAKIPLDILKALDLDRGNNSTNKSNGTKLPHRRLFLHQALAIESTIMNIHTVVQTATGSGKSLCFLVPVLAKAMLSLQEGKAVSAALLLFPTKALAQDQLTKIVAILNTMDQNPIRVGVIDGDTPHSQREEIATSCQIILTNPDTLHAAILPNWKKNRAYQLLLSRVTTVVVDEAHVYEGGFGAHVSLVLSRLLRICRVASSPSNTGNNVTSSSTSISFIACSATMIHPEEHFRLLCPIGKDEQVCVLASGDDGSPCPPKHFFVWNPPILDVNGISTGSVFLPKKNDSDETVVPVVDNACKSDKETSDSSLVCAGEVVDIHIGQRKKKRKVYNSSETTQRSNLFTRRRHAADETAFLLAKAITAGVRTIAFCKTRSLVEWVYNACLALLRADPVTSALSSQVESYRGGYTAEARRSIEERLFHRKLIGVVGTCALELGVDVGGVDLTLHTGYPGSISSLLQQSGRAGREKSGLSESSCAIMVCFSSPSEQYIWKNPTCLLSRGVDAPPSLPINDTVLHGHLLCAGEEFPLTGDKPVSYLLNENSPDESSFCCPSDCDLFGGPSNGYYESVNALAKSGHLSRKKVQTYETIYSTHPVLKNSWKRVSLRSIEPVSYSIVDLSHNLQAGKTDKLHHQAAVLDTIPYSRVFYHAFPGAIL